MAAKFWVGGTGNLDGSTTTHISDSTGGAGGAVYPAVGDSLTFDGASGGGTVTVTATVTLLSITMGAFTGTLDFSANNPAVNLSTFSGTGAGTRTLNLGNGTWTISATTGIVWNMATTTGLTFAANSSTILFAATPTAVRTFSGGALTYNNLTITDSGSTGFGVTMLGVNTFVNLAITVCRHFTIQANQTITGTFSYDGTSSLQGYLASEYTGIVRTVTVSNAATLTWILVQNLTKAGAGSIAVNNGFNGGGTTSITITAPSAGGSSGGGSLNMGIGL